MMPVMDSDVYQSSVELQLGERRPSGHASHMIAISPCKGGCGARLLTDGRAIALATALIRCPHLQATIDPEVSVPAGRIFALLGHVDSPPQAQLKAGLFLSAYSWYLRPISYISVRPVCIGSIVCAWRFCARVSLESCWSVENRPRPHGVEL